MTNNDADQLYDWPTVIQLIQMYGGIQNMGGIQTYGGMQTWGMDIWGTYRQMEVCTNGGIQMYVGVWMYGSIQMYGEHIEWGLYRHPQVYRQLDIPLHACQLHLKEYVKSFPFLSCWSWAMLSHKYRNRGQKTLKNSKCTPINTKLNYPTK